MLLVRDGGETEMEKLYNYNWYSSSIAYVGSLSENSEIKFIPDAVPGIA
jgi:hypothetical protein